MSVLPELPEAAVAAILQHVPLQQRLNGCALVCSAWAAAAAAATTDVNVKLSGSEQCQQLQDWLGKHGGMVQRLKARPVYTAVGDSLHWRRLQLPVWQLVQLRSLDLSNLPLQLAHAPQGVTTRSRSRSSRSSRGQGTLGVLPAAGAAALLPQLQELSLASCHLTLSSLSQLLNVTALSKLEWKFIQLHSDTKQLPSDQVLPTMWQQLQGLPNLSGLRLVYEGSPAAADIAPVSNLQQLRSFDITLFDKIDVLTLAAVVPAGLTALSATVLNGRTPAATDMPAASCVSRLRNLASLELRWIGMSPSCLSALKGLQELCLHEPVYADPVSGPRELLGALQHLTQLRHLRLSECGFDRVQQQGEGGQSGYQCFSALTTSSHLTALGLHSTSLMPVPMGAVDHMFPAGRVLPNLRVLTLYCMGWQSGHCVEAAHVARIAASCPALQKLTLQKVVHEGFDRSCLLQLPASVTSVTCFAEPGSG